MLRIETLGKDQTKANYDDFIQFKMNNDELNLFLKYAKNYQLAFKWEEQTDSHYKTIFYQMIGVIRSMEPQFMDNTEHWSFAFKYDEAAAIERCCKIIQIEIGEENEDQQFFQNINQQLFLIL